MSASYGCSVSNPLVRLRSSESGGMVEQVTRVSGTVVEPIEHAGSREVDRLVGL